MSRKTQLPDAILDMVSGGVLTFEGETVLDLKMCTDGYEITTAKGMEGVQFSKEIMASFDKDPSLRDRELDALEALHMDSRKYELSDLLGLK